ncbi:zinc finger protein 708-like [Drosophila mauritiana]|uniref:Zinc finger protein 708-like n=1 Tax=Drosophila mauritiana TaxID=7226 RepID=A0A6P8KY09_DROMA|nr:zinc finger protein 708-like [Drosophila mauritiana]
MDSGMCRVCMREMENMLCVFETMPLPGVSLATIISKWCGTPVLPKDTYPKTICQSCALDAQSSYEMSNVQVKKEKEMMVKCEDEDSNQSDIQLIEEELEIIDLTNEPLDNLENLCPNSNSNGDGGNVSKTSEEKKVKVPKPLKSGPYKCDNCPKSFMLPAHLKCHMWVHASEKPHKCLQCSKSFAQIRSLRRHELVHTSRREEGSYKCSQCPKLFKRNSSLKDHETKHAK